MVSLAVLVPGLARAQAAGGVTVTITNPTSIGRVDANNNGVTKRPTIAPEGINLQDCRDALQLVFPLNVAGFSSSDNFEVWGTDLSGADCTVATARSGSTQTCYKIAAPFSRTQTQSVNVAVKEIVKGLPTNTTPLPADGCRRVNAYTITLYFLVLRGTDVAGSAKTALQVDTQGPTALSSVRVQPGEAAVTVVWAALGEGGAEDIVGVQAFCDRSPTAVGASDAGASTVCTDGDGSVTTAFDASDQAGLTDAGVTCTQVPNVGGTAGAPIPTASNISSDGAACTTQAFAPVNGVAPAPDNALIARYGCGNVTGATASTIRVDSIAGNPLIDGKVYAVAIAATDSFGNLGELSSPTCQFPESTSDFWRDYRNAGGQSGGGFCAVESPGVPAASFSLLAVGLVFGFSFVRRMRRDRCGRRNDR